MISRGIPLCVVQELKLSERETYSRPRWDQDKIFFQRNIKKIINFKLNIILSLFVMQVPLADCLPRNSGAKKYINK